MRECLGYIGYDDGAKRIMFIMPIIHQHSTGKKPGALSWSHLGLQTTYVWKVDPSRMLRLPDVFHLPDVLTKASWRENRPKQQKRDSWWAKNHGKPCKLSRTKPVHGRIHSDAADAKPSKPSKPRRSLRSQGAIQSRDHWTLHHLRGCPGCHSTNSHTNGCVWKSSIPLHTIKMGNIMLIYAKKLHGNPMGKIGISYLFKASPSTQDLEKTGELCDTWVSDGIAWYSRIAKSWGNHVFRGFVSACLHFDPDQTNSHHWVAMNFGP